MESGATAKFLTIVWTIGFSTRKRFIKDWNDDPNAYQNTIKQQKNMNFASEAGSYTVSSKKKKKNKYRLSIKNLRFPCKHLVPCLPRRAWHGANILRLVLLSMSHVDRTMQKTPKSKLKKKLHQIHLQMSTWLCYVLFWLVAPTSIHLCWPGKSFFDTSFETMKDRNSLGFWQNYLVLYKVC